MSSTKKAESARCAVVLWFGGFVFTNDPLPKQPKLFFFRGRLQNNRKPLPVVMRRRKIAPTAVVGFDLPTVPHSRDTSTK